MMMDHAWAPGCGAGTHLWNDWGDFVPAMPLGTTPESDRYLTAHMSGRATVGDGGPGRAYRFRTCQRCICIESEAHSGERLQFRPD
jgi:hypothetical protein